MPRRVVVIAAKELLDAPVSELHGRVSLLSRGGLTIP